MKTIDILRQAKQLISKPENWNQGDWRKERDGQMCYCGMGALVAVVTGDEFDFTTNDINRAERLLSKAAGQLDNVHLSHLNTFAAFNDRHTHEEVMQAFDLAIAMA